MIRKYFRAFGVTKQRPKGEEFKLEEGIAIGTIECDIKHHA